MEKEIAQVLEFHLAFGLDVAERPTANLPPGKAELRARLLQEELDEYRQAAAVGDLEGIADALSDLLYVLLGTYLTHGLQDVAGALFESVHRSNLSKLDAAGKPVHRADGKVLKSERFSPPDLLAILERAAAERIRPIAQRSPERAARAGADVARSRRGPGRARRRQPQRPRLRP